MALFCGRVAPYVGSLEGEYGPQELKTHSVLRMQSKQPKAASVNDAAGVSKDHSFAEVLQSKSQFNSKGRDPRFAWNFVRCHCVQRWRMVGLIKDPR